MNLGRVGRLAAAEMSVADDLIVLLGENDARRIEERLGEDMAFEKVAAAQRHGAAIGKRGVP